ncbi:MAG TPA: hypothetical protein VHX12_05860, partial [Acidisoma sp.]|nr:hypothetical protein [Acidisoma sp.]
MDGDPWLGCRVPDVDSAAAGELRVPVISQKISEREGQILLALAETALDGSEHIGFHDGRAERGR